MLRRQRAQEVTGRDVGARQIALPHFPHNCSGQGPLPGPRGTNQDHGVRGRLKTHRFGVAHITS
jgi:hypothetical protein